MKFKDYIKNYLKEYVLYKEHEGVLDFIKWLQEKKIKEINNSNFQKLIDEFGMLDPYYIRDFYSEFINELRQAGFKVNIIYN
jgi:hypothetical protein